MTADTDMLDVALDTWKRDASLALVNSIFVAQGNHRQLTGQEAKVIYVGLKQSKQMIDLYDYLTIYSRTGHNLVKATVDGTIERRVFIGLPVYVVDAEDYVNVA